MTYVEAHLAADTAVLDADSHLMEPLDWLIAYADGPTRDKLRELSFRGGGPANAQMVRECWERRDDPVETARLAADVVGGPKGYFAYGAMDPAERRVALDQLGFAGQLVFSTFAPNQFNDPADLDLLYGGADAHNRGMIDFCAGDARLLPVAYAPLDDPARAARCVETALGSGAAAVWIPHAVPATKSPTHPDYDGVWARLAEAGVPMVLHFGGNGSTQMALSYHNNGRDPGKDFVGGGENVRSKDFLNVHHDAENLLSCLVLDGIFEQFPDLRCGVIELGAGWVPNLLDGLDHAKRAFGRNEPELAKLALDPSDYVRRQVRFNPWHFENVGRLVEWCGPELFMFSSDWPHPEGGRNPLAEVQASLDAVGAGPQARRRFYHDNLAWLLGR
ncbi:MAG: amidohydrolase [Acidimicrobiia bacterium]|nr:amidohydrolase [Acidimicrobiia bacterium]